MQTTHLYFDQPINSYPGYATDFIEFCIENNSLIDSLSVELEVDDDSHWDLVSDVKGAFATDAANTSSDEEDDQEDAISEAEEWVTDNLSHSGDWATVAMALWLYGKEEGQKWLIDQRESVPD